MQAVIHRARSALTVEQHSDPEPGPHDVVVRVSAISLNYVDVAYRDARLSGGAVAGLDAAGVVVAAAEDGSGPAVGSRVAGFGAGAWAELWAVSTDNVAELPGGTALPDAAALPAAGVTALQAVRALGTVNEKRVLVTGAAGGVGRLAVQIAAAEGAHVLAVTSTAERAQGLSVLGAAEVLRPHQLGELPVVDAVLDMVGGATLSQAFSRVAPGGRLLSIGAAGGATSELDHEAERLRGGDRWLGIFAVAAPFGPDLAALLKMMAAGRLDAQIGWRGSWNQIAEAEQALLSRSIIGKAVLTVG